MNVVTCLKNDFDIEFCDVHTHDTWEIIVQTKGEVTSVVGNSTYLIKPGDIIVVPPGTNHDGVSETKYSDMFFQAEKLDFISPVVVHDLDGSVMSLMDMMYKVMTEKEDNYRQIADNIAETMCLYIKKYLKLNYKYPFVNDLKNEIYNNISNPDFDLTKHIAKTGFNSDYLRRCFKSELEKTPLEYLTALRVGLAKNLLKQDTFVSVEDVSNRCGFNDSFYFSTCFKKSCSVSPLQYRKKFLMSKEK